MSATRLEASDSDNWMVEEENDFEYGSCMSFCAGPGQLLCKCFPKKKQPPPVDEVDAGAIAEGRLRPHDFELQQVRWLARCIYLCI